MSVSAAAKYELKNPVTDRAAELNVMSGTLGPDVLDISHLTRDMGVFTYDPGFMSTASTESKITYIDGDAGELLYRGYPVEQLAERSSYLEIADLLINGALPTKAKYKAFRDSITRHTMVNERLLRFFQGFHHDAHPMAMLSAVVASMAAFYYDTTDIHDPRHREIFAHRIIAKLPTIAAAAYKHSLGRSAFDADFDGVDPVGVKREIFPDGGYGGIRSLVGPDRVHRTFAAGRNAEVGAVAFVGTIRLVRCPLQLRLIYVFARDVLHRRIRRFLQGQGLACIGDALTVHDDGYPAFCRRDGYRMIGSRNLDWLAAHLYQLLRIFGERRRIADFEVL
jgi:Citrate synthase, C-terminal domain